MKKTKWLAALLLLVALMTTPILALAAGQTNEIPQRVEDGTVFVPLRLVAYAHDATVEWDGENHLITIRTAQGMVLTFPVEGVGGFIEDGTSWVPYEFIDMFSTTYDAGDTTGMELVNDIIQGIEDTRLFVDEHSQVLDITSTDGYVFQGRLTMPDGDDEVLGIVIDVGTSGPTLT